MSNNYRKPGHISPELLAQLKKNKPKKQEWHWSLTFTIFGIVFGGILTIFVWTFTLISLMQLLLGVVALAILSFVIQWKLFYSQAFIQKHFRIPISIYGLYNLGVGFALTGMLLTLNWVGASSTEQYERHRIVGFDRDYILDSNAEAVFLLENDAYQGSPTMRSMPYLQAIKKQSMPFLDIIYHKGLLGLDVFYGKRMSPDPNYKPEPVKEEAEEEVVPEETDTTLADSTIVTE
ncbi:MAG TPA: hypothetical protein VK177_10245 [Flavobacteriales bacterium]|nr:hypothetical protein [Flavobacteriales bacterium]